MESTDFADFEPGLEHVTSGPIAACASFRVEKRSLGEAEVVQEKNDFALVTLVGGAARCGGRTLQPGDFLLLPAGDNTPVEPVGGDCALLVTTLP